MPPKPPRVSIIVVTVNTPEMTAACLSSVFEQTTVPYELIVVSNSRSKRIQRILSSLPSRVRVIQNARNLGYTKAANQGIRASRGKYLCFLNSDTLVPPGWMERLLEAARAPRVGAVGPVSVGHGYRMNWNRRDLPDRKTLMILTDEAVRRRHSGRVESVPALSGFCLMIPRAVIDRTGLFDERFFFGGEDSDYSVRLRLEGFRLYRVPSLFIHHEGAGSGSPKRHRRLFRQARRIFLSKWRPRLGLPAQADERKVFSAACAFSTS